MDIIQPLFGGLLIGFAASIMLLFNGRVTGVSGILGGVLKPVKSDVFWRLSFMAGLLAGGLVLRFFSPEVFSSELVISNTRLVVAGLLVGFGTLLGNGCTSGHGVCGISRLSLRSVVATVVFMLAGIATVYLFGLSGG